MRISRTALAAAITLTTMASAAAAVPAMASEPAPVVTALSVHTGPTSGGTTLGVSGTGLGLATAVTLNGTSVHFSVVLDGSRAYLRLTTPAHAAGTGDLRVTSSHGTSAVSTADTFTYVAPAPTVTGLSPSTGSVAGGTTVTVTGTNFVGVTAVRIGDAAVKFTVASATSLRFVTPKHAAGATKIGVITAGGSNGVSTANTFTFVSTTTRK